MFATLTRAARRAAAAPKRMPATAVRVPAGVMRPAVRPALPVGVARSLSRHPVRSFHATSAAKGDMFCYQCEQTENGTGCSTLGVCGKTPQVAALQDLTIQALKELSTLTSAPGVARDAARDKFILESMFATLTNVNFDPERFRDLLREAHRLTTQLGGSPSWAFSEDIEALEAEGRRFGVESRQQAIGEDLAGLQELITYGLKGMCAYAEHASQAGRQNDDITMFVQQTLAAVANDTPSVDALFALAMEVGRVNLDTLALLDSAHDERFGTPGPSPVNLAATEGKAILVSGHDLCDLEALLKATEGTGINVYTHGEMLPAHGYPALNAYKHLKGNYGGAWQLQAVDFALFPGPVVVTTNCLIEPKKMYKDRIYSMNAVGWPGVRHIGPDRDFSPVIEQALAAKGFPKTEPEHLITTGFGHKAVLGMADTIVDLVRGGKINHFFFIGGCDGSEGERNYFKSLALATPNDSVILTAGCGKYRFNKLELGTVGDTGVPRVLDCGQCNDSYGAAVIAMGLAKAFGTDVNGLPLSFAVSHLEQKAAAVLLTLLHLNVQNIYLGPRLPAFITPTVLGVLVEKFKIRATGDADEDLKQMLG